MIAKTQSEIEILRESGKRLATILHKVKEKVKPGVSTKELDELTEKLMREGGDIPAFLNYTPDGVSYPYPASLCVSIDNEIVHGIPKKDRILKEGEIVTIDAGLKHKGLFTDMAITVPVGKINKKTEQLVQVTKEALMLGIEAARGGGTLGDVGYAIEQHAKKHKLGVVRDLAGHGVGAAVHEDPHVPNYGKKGQGQKLVPGMVLALEPMLTLGSEEVILDEDGYTYKTDDASIAAHFEHTILITEEDPVILTSL